MKLVIYTIAVSLCCACSNAQTLKELATKNIYAGVLYNPANGDISPMSIVLTSASNKIAGTDNVKGITYTISGTKTSNNYTLKESGGSNVTLSLTTKGDSLIGKWTSAKEPDFNEIRLSKKIFKYDPSLLLPEGGSDIDVEHIYVDFLHPKKNTERIDPNGDDEDVLYRTATDAIFKLNGSLNKLTDQQLKDLSKIDLEIIKNTMYARHGYAFKNPTIRQHFNFVRWYIPLFEKVELTPIEKENDQLLDRFIKTAKDPYIIFNY